MLFRSWSPSLTASPDSEAARDYWADPRPAVNYEGRYCYLWTKDFGARAQGYISFLSGMFGYGYGAIDIWLYLSTYDVKTTSHDGVERSRRRTSRCRGASPWSSPAHCRWRT